MAGKKKRPGLALTVIGAIFLVAALGVALDMLGLTESEHDYGAVHLVLYAAIGGALVYAGRMRAARARTEPAPDEPSKVSPDVAEPTGDMRRLTDHALDAADGLGVDTSGARDLLREQLVDASSTNLSVGGGDDDNPLLVAKMVGSKVNVRYWRLRGKPTFEIDLNVETGEVAYAKAEGEQLV